jgi:NADPH:quinone reductase-like Zn-dependent oxidoreductase
MKAIVQNAYGSPDILRLEEVAMPVIKENDVLVRVYASSLNAGDIFSLRGSPWVARFSVGFPKPKGNILGWDMSGRVEAVGSGLKLFQPGE